MKPQDMKDLKELIEFLKQYQVAEFDLDRGDLKIRLKFAQAATPSLGWRIWPGWQWPPRPQRTRPRLSLLQRRPHQPPIRTQDCTSSNRPSSARSMARHRPAQRPFVSPGDHVEKGQVICIVEAMKLMNEIESDAAGEIVKCFVTNGQPIEFGQPLFSIREG